MLCIMEDVHEMPQVICLHKLAIRQIEMEKNFVEQKHLHQQYSISLVSYCKLGNRADVTILNYLHNSKGCALAIQNFLSGSYFILFHRFSLLCHFGCYCQLEEQKLHRIQLCMILESVQSHPCATASSQLSSWTSWICPRKKHPILLFGYPICNAGKYQ